MRHQLVDEVQPAAPEELQEKPPVFDATYSSRGVYIPNADSLMEIRERGFGDLRGNRLVLSAYETYYLHEKGRIRVLDGTSELNLHELVKRTSKGKPVIWIKYLVYRDLRDRGYIVRESDKADFEVHGKGPERRLVKIIFEGGETTSLEALEKKVRFADVERKDLILAVVDRRTDIVYYSVQLLKDMRRNKDKSD